MTTSAPSFDNRVPFHSALVALLFVLAAAGTGLEPACRARADDGRDFLRWDPIREEMAATPAEELKPGCVYSHFSSRLNRRVWSYVQTDGDFWYALGVGTTLEARRLDIRATTEEARRKLDKLYPDLANEVEQYGRIIYVQLGPDDQWPVNTTAEHPTIYNLETGQRWEQVHLKNAQRGNTWEPGPARFLPVGHTWGYSWTVENGRYVLAPGWQGCGCLTCGGVAPVPCDCGAY